MLVGCVTLAACGGGGGGIDITPGPSPTPTPAPTPAPRAADVGTITINSSQSSASGTVGTVNAAVADVKAVSAAPGGAVTLPLPGGATITGSIACNSGNITYAYTYDGATGAPINYTYNYNNCLYGTATAGFLYNGSASLDYQNYLSSTNYSYTFTYNLTYSYTSGTYNYSGSLNYSQRCSANGGAATCSYVVGSNNVVNAQVTTVGTVTTISHATVTGTASNGHTVTLTFTNWVYDSTIGHPSSGTATITDGTGNQMTIEVLSTGYRVTIVYNGTSTVYTVPF
jgi:hypothetical protein